MDNQGGRLLTACAASGLPTGTVFLSLQIYLTSFILLGQAGAFNEIAAFPLNDKAFQGFLECFTFPLQN